MNGGTSAQASGEVTLGGNQGHILPWLVYPVTMTGCVALFFVLHAHDVTVLWATYIPVLIGAGTVTAFEWLMPARSEWTADRDSVCNDVLFMVVVQMVLPGLLSFLVAITLLRWLSHMGWESDIWVHSWPIGVQAVLMVLLADFLRYWLHVACHRYPLLWRLHAVHHSPKKLYWLNVGRFHPVEKSLQFLFDALPFILLDVGEEVLGLYFVFYSVNGFFQHCNIRLHFGWLNYVVSSAELHRWHHSEIPGESNANYGNNIIIWDLLFGTWFLPGDRGVGSLGLRNRGYPLDFNSQIKAPWIADLDHKPAPVNSWRDLLLNLLLRLHMAWIGWRDYRRVKVAARNPADTQRNVLRRILRSHGKTRFAAKHGLNDNLSIAEFQTRVPVQDYESLRDYIEQQDQTGEPWLNPTRPLMFNVTSGTTGSPKYLPVSMESLRGLRRCQRLATYVQYRTNPNGFRGKILGLVGAGIEGRLESGTPFGSASGWLYRSTPKLAQAKYVLPPEVFDLQDYQTKYYGILRLALQHRDITYLATANPSSLLRLLDLLVEHHEPLLDDIARGTFAFEDRIPPEHRRAILSRCDRPHPDRARELRAVLEAGGTPTFQAVWPFLQLVVTWTGGSCGVALKSLKARLPNDVTVIDLGILASELCATVTIDADSNAGLPTIWENFFEFVEVEKYEDDRGEFLTLDQLEVGGSYYLFVTTPGGLLRYSMHDIVRVAGRFENTPTLEFLQKGAGVTNITGEKLYESQVLSAMKDVEQSCGFQTRFFQCAADEEAATYVLYLEIEGAVPQATLLADALDRRLGELNCEYQAKRQSGRLSPLHLALVRTGTLESYKQHLLRQGRRESQFKTQALIYQRELDFDFDGFLMSGGEDGGG